MIFRIFFWVFVFFVNWNISRADSCFQDYLWIECSLVFHFFRDIFSCFSMFSFNIKRKMKKKKQNVLIFTKKTAIFVYTKIRTKNLKSFCFIDYREKIITKKSFDDNFECELSCEIFNNRAKMFFVWNELTRRLFVFFD